MNKRTFREEVANVLLAQLLMERGLPAHPETIEKKGRPDVLVEMDGLRMVLEGRKEHQKASLIRDVRDRVQEGMAEFAVAIFYPDDLTTSIDTRALKATLAQGTFTGTIVYYSEDGLVERRFQDISLDALVDTIRDIFHLRVKNDIVRQHVNELSLKRQRP